MSKIRLNSLLFVLIKLLIISTVAEANEIKYQQLNSQVKTGEKDNSRSDITPVAEDAIIVQPHQIEQKLDSMEQVTSVSQLSDVQPTDWAF